MQVILNKPKHGHYKVTIESSALNSKPIVEHCYAESERDAINRVCGWHQITASMPNTIAHAESQE